MNSELQTNPQRRRRKLTGGMWVKAAVVMLLVGVAGLSTLAKNGQYFSKASAARQVSISTKMDVVQALVIFHGESISPAIKVVPPQQRIEIGRVRHLPIVPMRQIGITVSRQHRAPPPKIS